MSTILDPRAFRSALGTFATVASQFDGLMQCPPRS